MKQAVRGWAFWLFVCCFSVLIYLIFRPESPPNLFRYADKVEHVIAFMILALVGRVSLHFISPFRYWSCFLIIAIAMETMQHYFSATRTFTPGDMMANVAGVIAALVLYKVALRVMRERQPAVSALEVD